MQFCIELNNKEMNIKIDLRTADAIKSNVQDKLLLLSYRMYATTKEYGFNEEYHKSDLEYKYAVIPVNDRIQKRSNKSQNQEEQKGTKKDEDESIPIQSYVSMKKSNTKLKKVVKKVMIVKDFTKNIITEKSVKQHLESSKNSGVSDLKEQKRIRMRIATFAI